MQNFALHRRGVFKLCTAFLCVFELIDLDKNEHHVIDPFNNFTTYYDLLSVCFL